MAKRAWITKVASWSGLKAAPGRFKFSMGTILLNSRMSVLVVIKIKMRAAGIIQEGTSECIPGHNNNACFEFRLYVRETPPS